MKRKINVKVIGIVCAVAGAVLSVISSVVDDKKMEDRIDEGISRAMAERDSEE